jgi:hypothetical protein
VIDVNLIASKPAGSPSFYTLSNTFTLPTGFTNGTLTIDNLYIDDRGVLQLNGTTIASAGLLFGTTGAGFMTLTPGGPNNPFTFAFPSGDLNPNLVITSGLVAGSNTLSVIVNDTNFGIGGVPLETGVGQSDVNIVASVSFDVGTAAIPEPATLTLLGISLVGLAGFRRRKAKQTSR